MIFTYLQLLLHLGATLTWSRIHSTGNQPSNKQPTILQTIQSVLLQTEMFLHEHTILANSEVFLGFPDDAEGERHQEKATTSLSIQKKLSRFCVKSWRWGWWMGPKVADITTHLRHPATKLLQGTRKGPQRRQFALGKEAPTMQYSRCSQNDEQKSSILQVLLRDHHLMGKRIWNFGSPKKLKQDQNWKVGEFFCVCEDYCCRQSGLAIVDDYDPLPFLHSGWLGSIPFACGNDYIQRILLDPFPFFHHCAQARSRSLCFPGCWWARQKQL